MRRALIFFIAVACLASVTSARSGERDNVHAIRIVQQDAGALIKYSVVLDQRLNTAELERLSQRIKGATPKTTLILILFFLRGMAEDRDVWAASALNVAADGFAVHIRETATRTNPPDADLRIAAGQ